MAAVLALKYRDEGREPQFAYQILIYPWMQVRAETMFEIWRNNLFNIHFNHCYKLYVM